MFSAVGPLPSPSFGIPSLVRLTEESNGRIPDRIVFSICVTIALSAIFYPLVLIVLLISSRIRAFVMKDVPTKNNHGIHLVMSLGCCALFLIYPFLDVYFGFLWITTDHPIFTIDVNYFYLSVEVIASSLGILSLFDIYYDARLFFGSHYVNARIPQVTDPSDAVSV